jgi:hypothetical protein
MRCGDCGDLESNSWTWMKTPSRVKVPAAHEGHQDDLLGRHASQEAIQSRCRMYALVTPSVRGEISRRIGRSEFKDRVGYTQNMISDAKCAV